jgi:hypothetical protein
MQVGVSTSRERSFDECRIRGFASVFFNPRAAETAALPGKPRKRCPDLHEISGEEKHLYLLMLPGGVILSPSLKRGGKGKPSLLPGMVLHILFGAAKWVGNIAKKQKNCL